MANNLCNESGKKSVRMSETDVKKAEELGLANTSSSTVFSELFKRAMLLQEIQKDAEEEVNDLKRQIREKEEKYGLNEYRY